MIITRTPYRISFFGGGTDFPQWYLEHGGKVVSTTISNYCYVTVKPLPPFYPHKIQIFYSQVERANELSQIIHPSVRETLRHLSIDRGLEIHHLGDLPARSGLGSSSAFTVGLLHALSHFKGEPMTREQMVENSIHIEQKLIGETVGSQDQTACCHGGLNLIDFETSGKIHVTPISMTIEKEAELQSHLLLFFTGQTRLSSPISQELVKKIHHHHRELKEMVSLAHEGAALLSSSRGIEEMGHLLHLGWDLKKRISPHASNSHLDQLYQEAMKLGAKGGKIVGAGSGGFMLLFAPPQFHANIRKGLDSLVEVPLQFEKLGTHIFNSLT